MALTDFDGLVAALLEEGFNNTELTLARRQRFVGMVEEKINRRVRHRDMLRRSDAVIGSETTQEDADALFALPAGFVGMELLQLDIAGQAEPAVLQFCEPIEFVRKQAVDDEPAQPEFYTLKAAEGMVYPTPDQAYTAWLWWYERPELLADGNQTNLWTDRYSDILFDGCMVRVAAFLKDFAEAERYALLFEGGLQEIEAEQERERKLAMKAGRFRRATADLSLLQRSRYGVLG